MERDIRSNRAGLTMSVVRGRPKRLFRGQNVANGPQPTSCVLSPWARATLGISRPCIALMRAALALNFVSVFLLATSLSGR
jgi:hypothetical protein